MPAQKLTEPRLSEELQEEILQWIELAPPRRTIRHLRKMLVAWMLREQSGFPMDFEEMLMDLDCLFELLDSIQDQIKEDPEDAEQENEEDEVDDEKRKKNTGIENEE